MLERKLDKKPVHGPSPAQFSA